MDRNSHCRHQRDCSDATRRSIELSGLRHAVDPAKVAACFRDTAKNLRLAASTNKRYVTVEIPRNRKKGSGNAVNPRTPARGDHGRASPTATTASVFSVNQALGLLFKGFPAVRITNSTRVCVASDSTNHPVWKRVSDARKKCNS